jgi:hypothetical protein
VPDWDKDSPRLRENLARVLEEIHRAAEQRETPTLKAAKSWQARIMAGLQVPDRRAVGAFRGERGLENVQVKIGARYGVAPPDVARELKRFEAKLQTLVAEMDMRLPPGREPDLDELAAIIDLCAWAHAEWVRIHPFSNGNGRTARLWANSIAMRYGLPPFIRLRPRPDGGYGAAAARAMQGYWRPTAVVFIRLLNDFLNEE